MVIPALSPPTFIDTLFFRSLVFKESICCAFIVIAKQQKKTRPNNFIFLML